MDHIRKTDKAIDVQYHMNIIIQDLEYVKSMTNYIQSDEIVPFLFQVTEAMDRLKEMTNKVQDIHERDIK
jgi:hypothetical protein